MDNMKIVERIIYEDFDLVKFNIELLNIFEMKNECQNYINELFNNMNNRDDMVVGFLDYENTININEKFNKHQVVKFIEQYILSCDVEGSKEAVLEVKLYKSISNFRLSVYSMNSFTEYLNSLSIESIIGKFQENIFVFEHLIFEMINDVGLAVTSRIVFTSSPGLLDMTEAAKLYHKNVDLFRSRNECCNHIGMNVTCSPHDYHFTKYDFKTDELKRIFARITTVVSILFISNISELKDNTIIFKINGYKTINGTENIREYSDIINISESIYQIFSWIYKDTSNIVDKIGITRNILTLYMSSANLSNINSELIKSIYSGYEIYLKENVERYIEILNQLTYFLNELNNQASNLASSFTNKFRNNLLGFLSFLLSTILFNTISTGKINNIFTRDMTIISIAMLVISICYLVTSIIETEFNKNKLKSKYDRNKRYYASILDDHDINRIFNNDDYFNEDKSFIQKNTLLYSSLWVVSIIVIVIVLIILGTLS